MDTGTLRKFETGATRDTAQGKYDPEGFWSPLVMDRYDAFMHKNRLQKDGAVRDSDNWQKGIPLSVYIKSAHRHFRDWWKHHRSELILDSITHEPRQDQEEALEEAICALMFNAMGFLHEHLKAKKTRT